MTLERLEITPFPEIAGEILQNRRSGHLTVIRAPMRKILYWSQGELVMLASTSPDDSLAAFLVRQGAVPAENAATIEAAAPTEVVARVHESGLLDLSARQTLLREWLTSQFLPLFGLDEGTAAFQDDEPLPPENRIFLQSTAALIVDGVRGISNGLVLRRALGDLQRLIQPAHDSRYTLDTLPLNDQERAIASSLTAPTTVEAFLRKFGAQSVTAGKVTVALLAVGGYETAAQRESAAGPAAADTQRELEMLAAVSAGDERSLRVINLARQIESRDYYEILDLAHAATRTQVTAAAEELKKRYDPRTYPAAVRPAASDIVRRVDEAAEVLSDPAQRSAYDQLLSSMRGESPAAIRQRLNQSMIAGQNLAKAKELSATGDYYGAIVLLKQAVKFAPDSVEAWHLLGACQERNPRWRREAAESYQKALAIDPENPEVLISLGDLYRNEGMTTRAQTCYSDALKIDRENAQAKSRLQALKGR